MSEVNKDSTIKRQDSIEAQAKRVFDDSVQNLDARTRSRLNQSRRRALQELHPSPSIKRWKQWVPAAAVAVAALAVLVWDGGSVVDTPAPKTAAADFELLMDQESLEMLEDLEFYSWIDLAADDSSVSGENVG